MFCVWGIVCYYGGEVEVVEVFVDIFVIVGFFEVCIGVVDGLFIVEIVVCGFVFCIVVLFGGVWEFLSLYFV